MPDELKSVVPAKASPVLFDPDDRELMKAIVTQRLRDARVRHFSLTLDYNIRVANRQAMQPNDSLSKSVVDRFVEQLDNQQTEAFANLQNAKTEVRVLTEELQKLDNG